MGPWHLQEGLLREVICNNVGMGEALGHTVQRGWRVRSMLACFTSNKTLGVRAELTVICVVSHPVVRITQVPANFARRDIPH